MVPTILANHPSKYRRVGRPLKCPTFSVSSLHGPRAAAGTEAEPDQPIHSQSHILLSCRAVSDLRAECEPDDDASLATFFRKVVARNMELEEEEEND